MVRFACDAILFDLDGVLINSIETVEYHWRAWAESHGLDGEEVARSVHGRRSVDAVRTVAPHLDAEAESARIVAAEGPSLVGLKHIVGAAEITRLLPSEAWAVATSGTLMTALTRLDFAGIPRPAVLVTAEDVTVGKPNPAPYLLAAERLGVPPARCLVIEDAPAGIEAAHAAGAKVIGITTTYPASDISAADAVIDHLTQLEIREDSKSARFTVIIRPHDSQQAPYTG